LNNKKATKQIESKIAAKHMQKYYFQT